VGELLVRLVLIAALAAGLLVVIRHPQLEGYRVHHDLVRLGQAANTWASAAAQGSPSPQAGRP
jgi:hypothetical protein